MNRIPEDLRHFRLGRLDRLMKILIDWSDATSRWGETPAIGELTRWHVVILVAFVAVIIEAGMRF